RMMVATIACQSVGMLLAAIITLALLKNAQSGQIGRLFLTMEGVIALVFFSLRLSEPDSPHWSIVRGRFAEAAEAFIRIMPEQREAVLQITDNAGNPGVANSVAAESTWNSDPFLSPLSSSYGAGRGSLVFDGYRYLWRRTFHPDYPGCN